MTAELAYRVDRGTLRAPVRMPAGQMKAEALLTRTGVFVYEMDDGTLFREYRPPEEVFHPDSIASLEAAFVTNNHPSGMVTIHDAKAHTVGVLDGQAYKSGTHLAAALTVFDGATLEDIHNGKDETSCGYTTELDHTPGVSPEGEAYDAVQRSIRYNHVAVVWKGRAGTSRFLLDSKAAVQRAADKGDARFPLPGVPAKTAPTQTQLRLDAAEETSMSDKLKQKLDEALADASTEKARADRAETRVTELEADLATEKKRADEQEARADAAVKSKADAEAKLDEQVAERVELLDSARRILGGKFDGKADGKAMSPRAIREAMIAKLDSAAGDLSKRSDDYVAAYLDGLLKSNVLDSTARLRDAANGGNNDNRNDGLTESERAHREMVANSWGEEA